ncbi:NAD(P)-binding protein [Aspergillus steynii IBT 23096]|uniref:NAD(P)-binding protein n=1 Tax=Aspergillus steynii IBT 23096 TaxID=1392250 RepID=A0A2I2GEH0_9EURO|nr:NAD(P)-binding protein [Aspergillus steynii IBT 23096]PLB51298.1 NAD(P)-binding protein [Aspergillus steynii IBT 23096]
MTRTILVTGATGQQGTSLIAALRPRDTDSADYRVLALSRSKTSPSAKHLVQEKHVTVVEGDLNDRVSIARVFQEARDGDGTIWGVFMVLAFPGLGKNADAEEAQGKLLADVALEYGVSAFIYSSALRSGPKYDDQLERSGKAKVNVERHVKEIGLPWAIVKPGFFMENFSGMLGPLAVHLMKAGMKPETRLDLVAAQDIGRVVAAVFKDFSNCSSREVIIVSESLTASQIERTYRPTTGLVGSYVSPCLARLVLKINADTQNLVQTINDTYDRSINGDYPEREDEIQLAKDVCPQRTTFHEWVSKADSEVQEGWNRVSIWGLLTGRS